MDMIKSVSIKTMWGCSYSSAASAVITTSSAKTHCNDAGQKTCDATLEAKVTEQL